MRVLVVANDRVGTRMAGAAIRSWELARGLARRFDVTLGVPLETDLTSEDFDVEVLPHSERRLLQLAGTFDAVVAQWLPPFVMVRLARSDTTVIYDLYDPVLLENLSVPDSDWLRLNVRATNLAQEIALATGDAFICASERQRDLWLGFLGALGRIDADAYARDPTLRDLVDVVPFGLPSEAPRAEKRVLKGVVDGIGADDRVLLWGGGIWDWLDPFTVISAVDALGRDDVKLFFLGAGHPHPGMREMPTAARARELAGARVIFNDHWVPYDERAAYLLESDVGVSAHLDNVEARFAFRTRILDYVWAGLPVVATQGDELAELVAARGAGRVVGFGDVDGWVEAISDVLARGRADTAALRAELAWPRVVEPLVRLLEATPSGRAAASTSRALVEHTLVRARLSLAHRGLGGAFRAGAARLKGR